MERGVSSFDDLTSRGAAAVDAHHLPASPRDLLARLPPASPDRVLRRCVVFLARPSRSGWALTPQVRAAVRQSSRAHSAASCSRWKA